MPDIKISQFVSAPAVNNNIIFPVVDIGDTSSSPSGTNKKLGFSAIGTYINSQLINPPTIGSGVANTGRFTTVTANISNIETSNNTETRTNAITFNGTGVPNVENRPLIFFNNASKNFELYIDKWQTLSETIVKINNTLDDIEFELPLKTFYDGAIIRYYITSVADTIIFKASNILQPANETYFSGGSAELLAGVELLITVEVYNNVGYITKYNKGYTT